VRCQQLRNYYRWLCDAALKLQALERARVARRLAAEARRAKFAAEYAASSLLQAVARGVLGRERYQEQQYAAQVLHRIGRGMLGRTRARVVRERIAKAKRIALKRYERLMGCTFLAELEQAVKRCESDREHKDPDIRQARCPGFHAPASLCGHCSVSQRPVL
jgi:hypothetical protein